MLGKVSASKFYGIPYPRGLGRPMAIVLPFLKLNPNFGLVYLTGSNVYDVCSHIVDLAKAVRTGQMKNIAPSLARTLLTTTVTAAVLFKHPMYHLILIGTSFGYSMRSFGRAIQSGDGVVILRSILSLVTVAIQMTIRLHNLPQLALALLLLNMLNELAKAIGERDQGRWPEAIASLIMTSILAYQVQGVACSMIAAEKVDQVTQRVRRGRKGEFSDQHPLKDLAKTLKERGSKISVPGQGEVDLGAQISKLGRDAVKGSSVLLRERVIDGREIQELTFKLNHVHRAKLEGILQEYFSSPKEKLTATMKAEKACEGDLSFTKSGFGYLFSASGDYNHPANSLIGDAHQMTCKGVGSVLVGASPDVLSLYDRVVVRVERGKQTSDMHFLLSLLGMEGALQESTEQDLERHKIGQLFRTHYPVEASKLERTPGFFEQSIDQLKETIVHLQPGMKDRLDKELPRMAESESLPGKLRYSMPSVAEQARDLGARALISGIGFGEAALARVSAILTLGALSSQSRFDAGMPVSGWSTYLDHLTGGADSVFTRLLTSFNLPSLSYGDVSLVYSLKALNRGTYQYRDDLYGTRDISRPYYSERSSIFDFVKEEVRHPSDLNEVMIKERIAPEEIVGCVVQSERQKSDLQKLLIQDGAAQQRNGEWHVNGVLLEDFISVKKMTPDLLARASA